MQASRDVVCAAARRLASASDFESFRIARAEQPAFAECAASAAAHPFRSSELLQAVVPALARGMRLLSEQLVDAANLKQHAPGTAALMALSYGWTAYRHALNTPDFERTLVQLVVQMTREGAITAFAQLATALARLISPPDLDGQQQQQQQQQQMGPAAEAAPAVLHACAIPELIVALLCMFGSLVGSWPGGMQALSKNPAMAQAVPAAAQLAVAAIRNKHAHWWSKSSRLSTANAAAALAMQLPRHIAGTSSSIMLLHLCCMALTAQSVHQQQHGLPPAPDDAGGPEPAAAAASAAEQQLPAVLAYHRQLQQALGLPECLGLAFGEEMSADEWLLPAGLRVGCVVFEHRPSSSSSSSSSRSAHQQQRLAEAAVDATLLAPLLLVLLECCLLQPEDGTVRVCLGVMTELLDRCVGLDCIPESLACDLPAAVLRLLLPVVRRLDAAAPAAAAVRAEPAAAAGDVTVAAAAGTMLLVLGACVTQAAVRQSPAGDEEWRNSRTVQALVAVYLQQPEKYGALMEAAVRAQPSSQVTLPVFSQVGQLLDIAADAADAAGMVLSSAEKQQVFALLVSCIKAGPAAADEHDLELQGAPVDAAFFLLLAANAALVSCALVLPGSSSSRSRSSRALPVHLLGRCLVAVGKALQHMGSSRSCSALCQKHAVITLGSVQLALDMVARQAPQLLPALPAPVLLQLLGERAVLQQPLAALQKQLAAGSRAVPAASLTQELPLPAATASVGEQLEAAGATAVAQVPVKHCCNFHGCTNRSTNSELELVGGKSCVCSRCRAARYCSRDCQAAHYKHWHKAVCKQLQQQRQQEQQEQA